MIEFLIGYLYICIYFIICASFAVLLRHLIKIPDEIFRKLLHFILLGSLFIWIYKFDFWWHSVLGCLIFALVVYPILKVFERLKTYSKVVTERKKGELKNSLLVVFLMFSIVIAIGWGVFNDKYLILIPIYTWGFGDAFAALVGKKFGKHKIYKNKSLEGTLSMFIVSYICALVILLIRGMLPWPGYLLISLMIALVVSIVELYTPNGMDTITCPLSVMTIMLPMLLLFGGLI